MKHFFFYSGFLGGVPLEDCSSEGFSWLPPFESDFFASELFESLVFISIAFPVEMVFSL